MIQQTSLLRYVDCPVIYFLILPNFLKNIFASSSLIALSKVITSSVLSIGFGQVLFVWVANELINIQWMLRLLKGVRNMSFEVEGRFVSMLSWDCDGVVVTEMLFLFIILFGEHHSLDQRLLDILAQQISSIQINPMEQFEIVKELGSGSFGRVYKVIKKPQNVVYAMKQIKMKELNSRQKDNALNEVRLLASIDAPNIIKYKSAFFIEQGSLLCIVMQFANGGDLAGIIKKKLFDNSKFKQDLIWKLAFDMLKGMKILHENNIIHRDIKTANVFIVDGVAKLGDLNVSKVMEGKFATTQTGTPYYTSPQIWTGKKYDSKCDVWSFGCLVYELCTLRPPFVAKDFPGLSKKVQAGYYDPISSSYSKNLSMLIRKCLTVDMAKRPTAAQLLKEDVFEDMQAERVGEIDLLDTIRCPRVLTMLNKQLPEKKYSKKLVTLKVIEDSDIQTLDQHKKKQLQKIASEKNILGEKENGKDYQEYRNILDRLKMPVQSPQGYVKLPKLTSHKKI